MAGMLEHKPLREFLKRRKTFILKEPLIKMIFGSGNPDNLIIRERTPVPGPEVKRIRILGYSR